MPSEHTGRQEASLLSGSCHHFSHFCPSHSFPIDFLMSDTAAFSYFLFLLTHYSFPPSVLFPFFQHFFGSFDLSPYSLEHPFASGHNRSMQRCLCATAVLRGDALSDVLPTSYTNSHYHDRVKRLSSNHKIL